MRRNYPHKEVVPLHKPGDVDTCRKAHDVLVQIPINYSGPNPDRLMRAAKHGCSECVSEVCKLMLNDNQGGARERRPTFIAAAAVVVERLYGPASNYNCDDVVAGLKILFQSDFAMMNHKTYDSYAESDVCKILSNLRQGERMTKRIAIITNAISAMADSLENEWALAFEVMVLL